MNIFKWLFTKKKPVMSVEFERSKKLLFETHTLRQMIDKIEDISITSSALFIFIEKICYDLEKLQEKK